MDDNGIRPAIVRYDPGSEFFTPELCYITELSNSATDGQLSVACARVAPGITTRWHRLNGISERYVVLSGQGNVEIGDLPAQPLSSLDVAVIPAGCRQRITNTGATDLVFLALCTPRFIPEAYEDVDQPQAG